MGAQENPIRIDTSLDRVTDWMGAVVRTTPLVEKRGRVSAVTGGLVRATVTGVRIADLCVLSGAGEAAPGEDVLAEVVGFDGPHVLMSPLGSTTGISNDTQVIATGRTHEVPVGPELLAKVLNGLGHPLDRGNAALPVELSGSRRSAGSDATQGDRHTPCRWASGSWTDC